MPPPDRANGWAENFGRTSTRRVPPPVLGSRHFGRGRRAWRPRKYHPIGSASSGPQIANTVCCRVQEVSMDAHELKEIQTPLKARYREDPKAAMITLGAEGQLGNEAVSCSVATGRAMVDAGLHPASGGDGNLACSGDMLLQALVACAGVTLRSVADQPGPGGGGHRAGGRRSRLPWNAGRGSRCSGRIHGDPTVVRPHDLGVGGGTQFPDPNNRALLRRSSDSDATTRDRRFGHVQLRGLWQ